MHGRVAVGVLVAALAAVGIVVGVVVADRAGAPPTSGEPASSRLAGHPAGPAGRVAEPEQRRVPPPDPSTTTAARSEALPPTDPPHDGPARAGDPTPEEGVGSTTAAATAGRDPVPRASATEPSRAGGSLVIWARGDLTPAFAAAVADLSGVTATAHVRSATLGLVGARHADGSAAAGPPAGYRIPVDVAAIEPATYAATVPPGPARRVLAGLGPGQAVLSRTGARLRGVGRGGEVDLAGRAGLRVVGVVPDGTVGRSEITIHVADADAAGLDRDGTVFLLHDAPPGPATDALHGRIEASLPADVTARIVDVTAGEPRRRAPLVLSLAQVKARFGEFAFRPRPGVREVDLEPSFVDAHIVTIEVPLLGSITCHRGIVADLRGALRRIVDAGLAGTIDPARYAGCFHPRRIAAGGDRLSRHSWGIALDINVDLTLPDLGPPPHPGVIAAFEAHGFRWGGDFIQPDNHHFEWIGDVTEAPPATRAPR